ncbi:Transposase [Cordylochernes scorpioides]|uniref:Transposase n=1 Tax=Cordylochernes scorpioides TaxID=51811 RepID=A0ABY6LEX9_9ARAC|nr:Transposase [Cordylochernes scorpioides]
MDLVISVINAQENHPSNLFVIEMLDMVLLLLKRYTMSLCGEMSHNSGCDRDTVVCAIDLKTNKTYSIGKFSGQFIHHESKDLGACKFDITYYTPHACGKPAKPLEEHKGILYDRSLEKAYNISQDISTKIAIMANETEVISYHINLMKSNDSNLLAFEEITKECASGNICQANNMGKELIVGDWSTRTFYKSPDENGPITLTMTSNQTCADSEYSPRVRINFVCDPKKEGRTQPFYDYSVKNCDIYFTWPTANVCPESAKKMSLDMWQDYTRGGSSNTGVIVLVTLLVLALVAAAVAVVMVPRLRNMIPGLRKTPAPNGGPENQTLSMDNHEEIEKSGPPPFESKPASPSPVQTPLDNTNNILHHSKDPVETTQTLPLPTPKLERPSDMKASCETSRITLTNKQSRTNSSIQGSHSWDTEELRLQSQTFTKVCLDHSAMINKSSTPTPHSMSSDVDLHATSPVAQNKLLEEHELMEFNAPAFVIKTGSTTQRQADLAPKEMAASDMRNRRHVQPLLTWSTNAAHPVSLDQEPLQVHVVQAMIIMQFGFALTNVPEPCLAMIIMGFKDIVVRWNCNNFTVIFFIIFFYFSSFFPLCLDHDCLYFGRTVKGPTRCREALENSPPLTVPRGYYRFDPRLPQLIARVDEDYHNERDHNEEGKDCPDRKEPRSKMEEQARQSNEPTKQSSPQRHSRTSRKISRFPLCLDHDCLYFGRTVKGPTRCREALENSPPLTVPRGYYRFDPRLPQLIARVDEAMIIMQFYFALTNMPEPRLGTCSRWWGHRKRRQFKQTDAFTRGMVIGLKRAVIVAVYACGVGRGERSNPAAIVERPTVRQRGIMGTMTAQRYVDDVLRPVTFPYLQGVPNALYQQDNARPHTARISQQALQDVQMLPWPPYSPDLSPIEHVWDIIGRRLHALPQPRSEDELWQMFEREWRAIPQDAIRTLIDSLPRRVAACIAVRGGPTCY